jgi:hypothetical protein
MADVTARASDVRTARRTKVLFAAAGLVIGAVAGTIFYALTVSSGDEPPIWVKNGSISIELSAKGKAWKQETTSAKWKIPNTARAHDQYHVFVAPSSATSCQSGFHHTGQTVGFKYSDGAVVTFDAAGNHSAVQPPNGQSLTLSADKKILTYDAEGGGHITEILVNSTPVCTFGTTKDANLTVVLLDK